ncbi:hypothetical protein ACTJJ7_20145 [Phyllobacterium sp. 22229]|uniref:hypothetical protein n=1 Tax=Phyllobacterium sp. 22229 TaxID=3453895 RepID=UPI003F83977B
MTEPSIAFLQYQLKAQAETIHSLKSGSGGGTYDDMEARVTRLEKAFEKMDGKFDATIKDIADLKIQTAVLAERINHLPSKEFIYKGIAGLITVMVAVSVLAPKLQTLFGVVGH